MVTEPVDAALSDRELQGEIELLASVMLGATAAVAHLTQDEVDSLLGLSQGSPGLVA